MARRCVHWHFLVWRLKRMRRIPVISFWTVAAFVCVGASCNLALKMLIKHIYPTERKKSPTHMIGNIFSREESCSQKIKSIFSVRCCYCSCKFMFVVIKEVVPHVLCSMILSPRPNFSLINAIPHFYSQSLLLFHPSHHRTSSIRQTECRPQIQIPFQKRTTAIHWIERSTNRRFDHHHQGFVTEVREGHRCWIEQGTEEHLPCNDLNGWESFNFCHLVVESKESWRDDQWIQDQLPAVARQQDS